jgi:hypothetical protein
MYIEYEKLLAMISIESAPAAEGRDITVGTITDDILVPIASLRRARSVIRLWRNVCETPWRRWTLHTVRARGPVGFAGFRPAEMAVESGRAHVI